jgi:gp32 DNA binding protein like
MSFATLKKQSQLGALTEKLIKEVEKMNTSGSSSDDREWKLECDKAGNGHAVIRFLPSPPGENTPFVKLYSHAFQGPGGWYIENSRTTLGEKDPLGEYNSLLWNNGTEAGKEQARKQKRKLTYVSNIYVVKDPSNPENEGKVFVYKYGKKIFDKISAALNPEFEDEEGLDPFDMWKGANFKLKAKQVAGYRNYDSSEFSTPSELSDDDDVLEKIWNSCHSLQDFISPDKFKTYSELKSRMNAVLNKANTVAMDESYESEEFEENPYQNKSPLLEKLDQLRNQPSSSNDDTDDDPDDTLKYFERLANE